MNTPEKDSFDEALETAIRIHAALVVVRTLEEQRALDRISAVSAQLSRGCLAYDVADGFQEVGGAHGSAPVADEPLSALEAIEQSRADAVFVLTDFQACWKDERVKRRLRNLARKLPFTKKTLIVTCPDSIVPRELADEAVVIELPLPGPEELAEVLEPLLRAPGVAAAPTEDDRRRLIESARGLTAAQARRAFGKALVTRDVLDESAIRVVAREKARVIAESQALQLWDAVVLPGEVGGLKVLKAWLAERAHALTPAGQQYGLPRPKGLLLLGIPGTGKSLAAKMTAGAWGLPLVRLDVGALFNSFVGESEARTRQALQQAEALAPAVLWVDEAEKALAQGGHDGGTSSRVFGTILTWMAEKTVPVFVVATCNDISRLPTEFSRKGRFDEVFFLDLPTRDERREILSVHLKKKGRDPDRFDLDALAAASAGYVGAELEQAVMEAMHTAFAHGGREFTPDDIRRALQRQVPLSVSHREMVEELRQWVHEGRARSASLTEAVAPEHESAAIEVRPAAVKPSRRTRSARG